MRKDTRAAELGKKVKMDLRELRVRERVSRVSRSTWEKKEHTVVKKQRALGYCESKCDLGRNQGRVPCNVKLTVFTQNTLYQLMSHVKEI